MEEFAMLAFITRSVAAAGITAAIAFSAPAIAAPIGPSAGLAAAAGGSSLTHEAAYICRPVWRHGRWERRCWWRPGSPYYGGYGYYGPRPYYGYRHYGWRHRPYYRRW
jgi:hypothetical protein